jgi:hypothetical protein
MRCVCCDLILACVSGTIVIICAGGLSSHTWVGLPSDLVVSSSVRVDQTGLQKQTAWASSVGPNKKLQTGMRDILYCVP